MKKAVVRSLLAQSYRFTGILGARERASRTQLTILCYHRILPAVDKAAYFCPDLVVTPEAFRHHCQIFAEHYRVLPLTEAVDALPSGPHPKPLLVLTFDDGYVDNLQYAAPILAEFGQRATFFVVSGLMGSTTPPWYDVVARCVQELAARGEGTNNSNSVVGHAKTLTPDARRELAATLCKRLGGPPSFHQQDLVMDATQLRQLASAGHEIGSHSVGHEILSLLDDIALESEIQASKRQLEEAIDSPVTSFCYPNGDHDARSIALVESCRYSCAVTTLPGSNDAAAGLFTLRRRFIHEERLVGRHQQPSATLLRAEVSGLNDFLLGRGLRRGISI